MSNKDLAWEAIFDALNIENQLKTTGQASVTADEIKSITASAKGIGQQEPRLITKFDTREQRASILRHHDCTILATSNGSYTILKGDGYHDTEVIQNVEVFTSDKVSLLETLPTICTSESQVIDTAVASGLLQHFLGDNDLALTIRGRLRSGQFDFNFGTYPINVDGVQVEVDAGYEGKRIYLLEAKMGSRDNFITRQLYYPYRMWNTRGVSKEIIPVFVSYSDQTFSLYEYKFSYENQYNSIELVKSGSYVLANSITGDVSAALSHFNSRDFLATVPAHPHESPSPFPQADDIRKVIDTIDAVSLGFGSKSEISDFYEFDERQSDYYGNAARYLGFLDHKHNHFELTEEGKSYVAAAKNERELMLVRAMMGSPTINTLLKTTIQTGSIPGTERIISTILDNRPELNQTTSKRRAHTMEKWLQWLFSRTT